MPPRSVVVNRLRIAFKTSGIKSVITISELDNTADRIAYGGIVMCNKVLQSFHQATLHVTSFSCLDGSIDQTFSTRDGVEQEFRRCEAGVETVANKALGRGRPGLLWEMRQ